MLKSVLLALCLLFFFATSNAQPPNLQYDGSPTTLKYAKGLYGSDSGYVFRTSFSDTSNANLGWIKNVAGVVIRVVDTLFIRNYNATKWIKIGAGSSGGGLSAITADNGLTANTISNAQLGGSLLKSTTINSATFPLIIDGSVSDKSLSVTNNFNGIVSAITANATSSSGTGIQGIGGNIGVSGVSANGTGVSGASVNGYAVSGVSSISPAASFQSSTADNNSIKSIANFGRVTTGTPANNIGGSIDIYTTTSALSLYPSLSLATRWTDVNHATRTSNFEVYNYLSSVAGRKMSIEGNGRMTIDKYGVGSFVGTPVYRLGVSASGVIIEDTSTSVGSGITSIAEGFGMNNSTNPITTTGTVAVDSGVIATRNYVDSFYNNVEQLNDSTFTIKRENGIQDTIQILTGIANVIDSLRRLSGSTIVQALKNGVWVSQYIDSVGSGSGVSNVSRTNGYGISASVANPTTTPDITIAIDSATVFPQIRATIPSSGTDTTSLSNRINLKVNISDTASMLNSYLKKTDTTSLSSRINSKVNIADTSSMLTQYLRKTDTASLSSRINTKLNISDTTVFARKGTWTDYSATSTITGWSSYTTKLIQYEVSDKTMRVMVQLEGTGSGTTTSFTLPLNATAWGTQYFILQTQNNTTQSASVATVSANGNTVTVSNSASTTSSWTNAVLRNVRGQFIINIQ